jgi:DNA gyrase subunit A
VRGINSYGRASQGVRVMNLREDDVVSAVARVMEQEADTAAEVAEELPEGAEAAGAEASAPEPTEDGGAPEPEPEPDE